MVTAKPFDAMVTSAAFASQRSACVIGWVSPMALDTRSMAGMRMGTFLSADAEFIKFCRSKCLDAYPLPKASVDAALAVTTQAMQEIAKKNIKTLIAERERLQTAFTKSKLTVYVYPSDTNYFLVELKDAKGFLDYCAKHKIILRDFSTKKLTENCLRISSGTPEQNDLLLKLLSQFEAARAA